MVRADETDLWALSPFILKILLILFKSCFKGWVHDHTSSLKRTRFVLPTRRIINRVSHMLHLELFLHEVKRPFVPLDKSITQCWIDFFVSSKYVFKLCYVDVFDQIEKLVSLCDGSQTIVFLFAEKMDCCGLFSHICEQTRLVRCSFAVSPLMGLNTIAKGETITDCTNNKRNRHHQRRLIHSVADFCYHFSSKQ